MELILHCQGLEEIPGNRKPCSMYFLCDLKSIFAFFKALQEKLDREVSSKDVVNVEKVVDDILSHPHRKHFGTLNIPNEQSAFSPSSKCK